MSMLRPETSRQTRPCLTRPGVPNIGGRRLRVLHVSGMYPTNERPHWGTFVASQVESLRARGVEIDLIHPRTGSAIYRYTRGAVEVGLRTLSGKYDLVHAHFGMWGWSARAQFALPVVMSFCGDDLLGRPDGRGGRTFKSDVVVRLGQVLARTVDAVIVKSDEMAQQLPGVRCHVIPNGVSFDRFRPMDQADARRRLELDPNATYAVFIGNPAELRKRYQLAAAVVQRASELAGHDIQLLTVVQRPIDHVVAALNAADALLMTSLWEGSPNVVKEALACNLPVVSVRVGDVPELATRTDGIWLAAPTAEDLGRSLVSAIRPRRRTTARQDIAHLELDIVAERVLDVYSRVLAR